MVDVVEYICCCGDVAVVEIRVIHSTITLLYVKSQWAIKLVHYKVKYINNEVALMVKKKVIPVFACDLLGKTSQKFISSN